MAREGIDIIHSDGTTETWYATSATVGSEVSPNPTPTGTEADLTAIEIDGTIYKIPTTATGISYLTTEPNADNPDGDLKIVILSSEPTTKYDGYFYIVTE